MEDENHQEGDSITFFYSNNLCRIRFNNSGLGLQVENECGDSAISFYSYQIGEDTVTVNGNHTCEPMGSIDDYLSDTASDIEGKLNVTFEESEWDTNINWRNAVEWFEI